MSFKFKIFVSYDYTGRIGEHTYTGNDTILIEAPKPTNCEDYDEFYKILNREVKDKDRFDVVTTTVLFLYIDKRGGSVK